MKKKPEKSKTSELGTIIDSSEEDFKTVIEQYNIGYLRGLKLVLVNAYEELKSRKDYIIKNHTDDFNSVKDAVEKLFIEMQKIEKKCTIIEQRCTELSKTVEQGFAKSEKK